MIISIPNFKPVFGYLFFLGMLFGIAAFSWDYVFGDKENLDLISIIVGVVFGTASLCCILFMSYRFSFIVLSTSTIRQIHPFRLKEVSIKRQNITNIKWEIWDTHKLGVYRKMKVIGIDDQQIVLTDLEFSNFDRLQESVLTSVNFVVNLPQKRSVEISQARTNRPINYFVIPLLVFFIFLNASFINFDNSNLVRISIILILSIIVWRLVDKIIKYNNWLEKFNTVRKRRLRKLKENNNSDTYSS